MDILNMSALELSKNIQSGVISVKEAVDAYLNVIEEKDKPNFDEKGFIFN